MTITQVQTSTKKILPSDNSEIELLLSCARTQVDSKTAAKIKALVEKEINWNYLLEIASAHEVIALLYQNLNTICPQAVPPSILSQLRSCFQTIAQRNLLITSELLKILNLFQTNNISAIPFKGATVAAFIYGNLALRQFSDLDIIVPKKDFIKAKELLLSNQYQSYLTKLEEIFLSNHAFQIALRHSSDMFSLDLHWGIAPRKTIHNSRFNCLWNNLGSISIGGQLVPNFSPESTLVILCINATKEPYQQSLKQICDINETIQAYPELSWDIVLHQARQLGCRRLLLIGLYLTQKLYGTILPEKIMEQISSLPVVRTLAEELKQRLFIDISQLEKDFAKTYFVNKYNFQTTEFLDRLSFSLDKIITPHAEDRQFITLSPSLYYLYYLIRPIRLIRRAKLLFGQSSPIDK